MKVEVVMNRIDGTSMCNGISANVVETFDNIDVIEVSNQDRSLNLKRTAPQGTTRMIFYAAASAWLSYKIVEE